ncbi:hypothetical protein K458DRAFT_486264 [Lentithecium fluviatile CBS 122367]|uniref:Uncharacterized protein n=1 Tax=Lentithecium fluviatile CBS 122367 TaxID=1168545 RepID=A0A6G1J7T0_9PLEO|nr:hypothetical protein K458DRAFT_486264 [Lentithecium fluviatile CBS 122367]
MQSYSTSGWRRRSNGGQSLIEIGSWFPKQMAKTTDPDLVTITAETDWRPRISSYSPGENKLSQILNNIEFHFRYLTLAGTPYHLLIGRRHPDISSCYWGWPHDESDWEKWKDRVSCEPGKARAAR